MCRMVEGHRRDHRTARNRQTRSQAPQRTDLAGAAPEPTLNCNVLTTFVIPAQAGIQSRRPLLSALDSRRRGNDDTLGC